MTKAPLTKAIEAHEQDTLTDEPPEEPDSENTVYVVASSYDDDPHPHVEGVFSEEEDANELRKKCADVASPPHPIAWTVIKQEVDDPTFDK